MKECPSLWILMIGGLFAIQTWLVPAVVDTFTGSELLKGTPEQGGSALPVTNENTQRAFTACNRHIENMKPAAGYRFSAEPERSWDIGFGRYMIRASVVVGEDGSGEQRRAYLCHARFGGGNADEIDTWQVDGVEFSAP